MMHPNNAEKELDKAAHELVKEFAAFYQKEILTHPGFSKSDIFEPWAMQKISNLNFAVTLCMDRINKMDWKLSELDKSWRKLGEKL